MYNKDSYCNPYEIYSFFQSHVKITDGYNLLTFSVYVSDFFESTEKALDALEFLIKEVKFTQLTNLNLAKALFHRYFSIRKREYRDFSNYVYGAAIAPTRSIFGGDCLLIGLRKTKGDLKIIGNVNDGFVEQLKTILDILNFTPERDISFAMEFRQGLKQVVVPVLDGLSFALPVYTAILAYKKKRVITKALSGKINKRGKVLYVSDLKEKIVGCIRCNIKELILPGKCKKEIMGISKDYPIPLSFNFIDDVKDINSLIFSSK